MPRCVFLLGPDHWDDGVEVARPAWARDIPEGKPFTPKDFRLQVAAAIERESEGSARAVVMDDKHRQGVMTDDELFHHIETAFRVDAYYIVVPANAKVQGTIFEGGMLVRDFHYGRAPVISLFFEETYARRDEDGSYEFQKGKRTRYLTSLVQRAHRVQTWRTLEDAIDQMVERALAD